MDREEGELEISFHQPHPFCYLQSRGDNLPVASVITAVKNKTDEKMEEFTPKQSKWVEYSKGLKSGLLGKFKLLRAYPDPPEQP